MRRTVPPSAEIEEQIDELLAVGVGENPRESLSGLAKLGARLIISGPWRMSSMRGWGAPGMGADPTISEGCATTREGCATGFARASCRPPRASSR